MKILAAFGTFHRILVPEVTLLIAALGATVAKAQLEGLPPQPPAASASDGVTTDDSAEDIDVLTHGPLHEAFAAPVANDPEPGEVVQQPPPEPIDELPPEVQPDGRNVQWIPGYWAWDDVDKRYIWISGVWRDVPPGREWVPGYWTQDAGGHRWVSGYWGVVPPSGAQVAQEVYDATRAAEALVAPPPQSLEVGPTSPPPSDQHFWIPGAWIAGDAGYRWRPGYWYNYVPNWVWVPDQYVWTPAGCVFVPGYWDYTLAARGLCFAPVYFNRFVYTRPNYVYRPYCALDIANVALHLFVHPRYPFYCYGNYYGATFASFGYRPWFQLALGFGRGYHPRYYDPLLTYYNTHFHRHGIGYVDRLRGWHAYYDRHLDQRPPLTFARQRQIDLRDDLNGARRQTVLARPVDEIRGGQRGGPRRLATIDRTTGEAQQRQRRQIQASREVARTRRALEVGEPGALPRGRGRGQSEGGQIARNDPAVRERNDSPAQQARLDRLRTARERARDLAQAARQADDRGGRQRRVTVVDDATRSQQPRQMTTGEQVRRAIERARESARNSPDSARDRRAITRQPPQSGLGRQPEVVRGPSRQRAFNNSPPQDARNRQRVLRLGTPDAQDARTLARERLDARNSQVESRMESRSPAALQRTRGAIDSARRVQDGLNAQRARDAARARQSLQSQQSAAARQRSVDLPRSAARDALDRARSQGLQRRGSGSSFAPFHPGSSQRAAPRQIQRPAATGRTQPTQVAPRQIRARQAPVQRAAPLTQRGTPARQRTVAPRVRSSAPRARTSVPRAQARARSSASMRRSKPTAIRPSVKANPGRSRK